MRDVISLYRITNAGESSIDLYPNINGSVINFQLHPQMVVYLRHDQFSDFTNRQLKRYKLLRVKEYFFPNL